MFCSEHLRAFPLTTTHTTRDHPHNPNFTTTKNSDSTDLQHVETMKDLGFFISPCCYYRQCCYCYPCYSCCHCPCLRKCLGRCRHGVVKIPCRLLSLYPLWMVCLGVHLNGRHLHPPHPQDEPFLVWAAQTGESWEEWWMVAYHHHRCGVFVWRCVWGGECARKAAKHGKKIAHHSTNHTVHLLCLCGFSTTWPNFLFLLTTREEFLRPGRQTTPLQFLECSSFFFLDRAHSFGWPQRHLEARPCL